MNVCFLRSVGETQTCLKANTFLRALLLVPLLFFVCSVNPSNFGQLHIRVLLFQSVYAVCYKCVSACKSRNLPLVRYGGEKFRGIPSSCQDSIRGCIVCKCFCSSRPWSASSARECATNPLHTFCCFCLSVPRLKSIHQLRVWGALCLQLCVVQRKSNTAAFCRQQPCAK